MALPITQPEIDSYERRCLVLKTEVTEGVDPVGTAAANAFDLLDGKSSTSFDKKERKRDRPFFTNHRFSVTNKVLKIEGGFELAPPPAPGADAAAVRVALLPCGMAQTLSPSERITRYSPISIGIGSVHGYWYHSGTYRRLIGARGNITGLSMAIDEVFKCSVSFEGRYINVTEADLPSDANYTAFRKPTVCTDDNTQLIINSEAAGIEDLHVAGKSLSVDFGNELKTRRHTELARSKITNRLGTWKAVFARPAVADMDVYALRDNEVLVEFDWLLHEADRRYSLLHVKGQIEQIAETNIDGEFHYELSGLCIASDTGGDEFYVAFGDDALALLDTVANGEEAVPYDSAATAVGEYEGALAWSISVGALPPGLAINAVTGAITGTPTEDGVFAFTVRAEAEDGQVATVDVSVTILSA